MTIILNNQGFSTNSENLTVSQLLKEIQSHTAGIAVAVNNKVVRKVDWDSTALAERDIVTVITAVCGG